ncbi:Non-specific lipid-transfer protein 2 [Sesamum angolense]|uniref:Non-specific lipid-transfer protein n=1 Tax=Sesamum angolense TaxID=2727404 RepID=A0AAE1T517_9LAMI|nr:Non-specific lipid-transfer protein 2 [Sesamum angolense]
MAGIIKPMCIVLIARCLGCGSCPLRRGGYSCCSGVKGLYGAAKTTPDRQSVCSCLKSLAGSYKDVDLSKAAGLPVQCGVNIPYKISPSTDCSKVN